MQPDVVILSVSGKCHELRISAVGFVLVVPDSVLRHGQGQAACRKYTAGLQCYKHF